MSSGPRTSDSLSPSGRWLLARLDQVSSEAPDDVLARMVEDVATATADAVTVRRLSADGERLVRVASYHPDPEAARAIASVMAETADARSGLWADVVVHRRPRRWHVDPTRPPAEASAAQDAFLDRFAVRAVLGVPLVDDDDVVGGLSLFRLGVDRPYTEADEALLVECARRFAPVVARRRLLPGP